MELHKSKVNEIFIINTPLVYLTSLYIIVWYLQLGIRVPILGAIRFEFLLGAFLGISALLQISKDKQSNSTLTKFVYIFFVFLAIQVPLSVDVGLSFNIFVDRVLKFSLLALFISTFIRSPHALKIFVFAFLLACFKLGSEGFLGWRSGGLVWENQGIMRLHGSIPVLKHPNSFSGFGVGLLPFIYYLFPQVKRRYKLLLGILLVFAIIIIIFTGSRTGYVATIGFIIYVTLKSKYRVKIFTGFALLLVFSIPSIPEQYLERFESIYSSKKAEGNSREARIQILEDSFEIFKDNPLGVGVGAFPTVREQYFGRKQDTHNLYFEILTNTGIQGFIVFILLIKQLFNTIKNNEKHLTHSLQSLTHSTSANKQYESENLVTNIKFCIAIGQAVRAFIVARLFLGLFGMDLYEIYWWLAIGLTIAVRTISIAITKSMQEFNRKR